MAKLFLELTSNQRMQPQREDRAQSCHLFQAGAKRVGGQFVQFNEGSAKILIDTINNDEPKTDYVGESVLAIEGPESVIFTFIKDGCSDQLLRISKALWTAYLVKAFGSDT